MTIQFHSMGMIKWSEITVESIKADLKSIEEDTASLVKALTNTSVALPPVPELMVTLVNTPFTKTNPANARAKFPDMAFPDDKVREAASEARLKITSLKRSFFANSDVYGRVKDTLNSVRDGGGDDAVFARGLLKKFYAYGLFHIEDLDKRKRVQDIMEEVSALESKWKTNLQDSVTNTRLPFKESDLDGIPDNILATMDVGDQAGTRVVRLTYPHVQSILGFCTVRSTREYVHKHFISRGGSANEEHMLKVAKLRLEAAKLQGMDSFSDVIQSQNRMAGSSGRVEKFLSDMEEKTREGGKKQRDELEAFAKEHCAIDSIARFDSSFVLNAMRAKQLDLDVKAVNLYFPSDHVVGEVMKIYENLLTLQFDRVTGGDVWEDTVQLWRVVSPITKASMGTFYLDLWPREGKYGHACVCNLTNTPYGADSVDDSESCVMLANLSKEMTHSDVVTFFHEFGHVMHNVFSRVGGKSPYAKVPRDFVEAPSQMLENWCWQPSMLKRLSKHIKDGSTLPDHMIEKLQQSRFWMGLLGIRRQLSLSQFDLCLHSHSPPETVDDMAKLERELVAKMSFHNSTDTFSGLARNFGHTMSQYSASYYGYMWSEVFSADMFGTKFESEAKLVDPAVGSDYSRCILTPGGTQSGDEMLKNFLGRDPKIDAFMKQHGM